MTRWFHSGDPDEWKPYVAIGATMVVMFVVLAMLVSMLVHSF